MNIKLDNTLFNPLLKDARESPRKRSHFNLHDNLSAPVQRLCVGLKKGTYIRPHHHPEANKWEMIMVLKGTIDLVIFDTDGSISERNTLNQQDAMQGIELKPNTWHMIVPVSDESIILEIKEGPYIAFVEANFASWSPQQGDADVSEFLQWVEAAEVGERYC